MTVCCLDNWCNSSVGLQDAGPCCEDPYHRMPLDRVYKRVRDRWLPSSADRTSINCSTDIEPSAGAFGSADTSFCDCIHGQSSNAKKLLPLPVPPDNRWLYCRRNCNASSSKSKSPPDSYLASTRYKLRCRAVISNPESKGDLEIRVRFLEQPGERGFCPLCLWPLQIPPSRR